MNSHDFEQDGHKEYHLLIRSGKTGEGQEISWQVLDYINEACFLGIHCRFFMTILRNK